MTDVENLNIIWGQNRIPVIYRRGTGFQLLLKLPYMEANRSWLKNHRRNNPKWNQIKKTWEIPSAWFNDTVERSLKRWGKVYIIQPISHQEICAPACWNAQGHECQCSCLGKNHGASNPYGRWYVVSEAFATKYYSRELACRLLITNGI